MMYEIIHQRYLSRPFESSYQRCGYCLALHDRYRRSQHNEAAALRHEQSPSSALRLFRRIVKGEPSGLVALRVRTAVSLGEFEGKIISCHRSYLLKDEVQFAELKGGQKLWVFYPPL